MTGLTPYWGFSEEGVALSEGPPRRSDHSPELRSTGFVHPEARNGGESQGDPQQGP